MKWIVSTRGEIVLTIQELNSRSEFIRLVVGIEPTPWKVIWTSNERHRFYICFTDDGINGVVITGHIGEVAELCRSMQIDDCEFVVANTCVWEHLNDKQILYMLRQRQARIKLWFAKQELSMEKEYYLRNTNILSDVGDFGFPTSKSERILFANRKKGFIVALEKAFEPVSPIFLPKDYGAMFNKTCSARSIR